MQELELNRSRKESVLPINNQTTTTLVIENIPSEALNVNDVIYSYFDKGPSEEEIAYIRAMSKNRDPYVINQDFKGLTKEYQQQILEMFQNMEEEYQKQILEMLQNTEEKEEEREMPKCKGFF